MAKKQRFEVGMEVRVKAAQEAYYSAYAGNPRVFCEIGTIGIVDHTGVAPVCCSICKSSDCRHEYIVIRFWHKSTKRCWKAAYLAKDLELHAKTVDGLVFDWRWAVDFMEFTRACVTCETKQRNAHGTVSIQRNANGSVIYKASAFLPPYPVYCGDYASPAEAQARVERCIAQYFAKYREGDLFAAPRRSITERSRLFLQKWRRGFDFFRQHPDGTVNIGEFVTETVDFEKFRRLFRVAMHKKINAAGGTVYATKQWRKLGDIYQNRTYAG